MKSLVGRYKLKRHGIFTPDGLYKPSSNYLNGELFYGSDNNLSVLILFKETPDAAKDIFGYVGTYRVITDKIVEHHFTVATSPSQVNSVEERNYEINGDELRLGRTFENGNRFEAVWVKYC